MVLDDAADGEDGFGGAGAAASGGGGGGGGGGRCRSDADAGLTGTGADLHHQHRTVQQGRLVVFEGGHVRALRR